MIRVDLSVILEKLGEMNKIALEEAAGLCIERRNSEVTILHLLYALTEMPLTDCRLLLKDIDIDLVDLQQEILKYLPHGETVLESYPVFSPLLVEALQDAWLLSTTELHEETLRSGAFLLAVLLRVERYLPFELVKLFSKVNRESLRHNFREIFADSAENTHNNQKEKSANNGLLDQASYLKKYAIDLTAQAQEGELDPVLSRDEEIYLMIDILSRRRKNNPIVVGDAGVGKSALIEGLAQKIVAGDVPETLQGVTLYMLDLGLLQAGASVKGEFEKRLKGVIEEVKNSQTPIILFIDEAHTLIGAGNSEGGGDAANLLKPALARGELRTIAATTWREYKKYFEKDPALSRRFQLVMVEEPHVQAAVNIMRGLRETYEKAHKVMITDDALVASVVLSERYLAGRQLPDKAIDVLDTACARVSINFNVPPLTLTNLRNNLDELKLEKTLLEREFLLGNMKNESRYADLLQVEEETLEELESLENRWNEQKELTLEIRDLRDDILNATEEEKPELLTLLLEKEALFEALVGDMRLVNSHVDEKQIASVISDWTGVPINQMNADELVKMTELPMHLEKNIKGQNIALEKIHQRLLTSRADLQKTGRPQGAFLLVGPSGVGKTETALQIAELLYGGKQFITTINMSEYQEKHTVSRLIGSPPGYVGYGEGGILTEAIRQKPYSIVLLDEVEKAHPEVLNIFYQVFDKGEVLDGEGRLIDCQNILFFLTSNLGYQTIVDYADRQDEMADALYKDLTKFFQPALLARMEVVPYLPLEGEVLEEIIIHKLNKLKELLTKRYEAEVTLGDGLVEEIRKRATRSENGARLIESIIEGQLLPSLSLQLLQALSRAETVQTITLDVVDEDFTSSVTV